MKHNHPWARILVVTLVLASLLSVGVQTTIAGTDVSTIFGVNEPHNVVVSPLDPHKVAVSAANAIWLSNDEGRTSFAFLNFPFPSGPPPLSYGTCGDSSLAFDSQGRLFWTILGCGTDSGGNSDVGIFVARINFDAGTIDTGFPVCAACGNNANRDKQWIAADAGLSSPFRDNVYIAWSDIGASNQIKFMRSTDGGTTWSASANLSNVKGECANDARFPDDAVDPAGNLYIAWNAYCGSRGSGNTGVINMVRSPNGGADILAGTFNTPVQVFLPGQAEITWNLQNEACPVPGSKSLWAGSLQPFVIPDPTRPGNVYVIAADDPNNDYCTAGLNDPADVVFARSTDYGDNWARSTISHGPVGTFQVFPTGAIDQQGNMFATWYDNRSGNKNAGGDFLLDRYATVSKDGGLTWSNDFRINDAQFDPDLAAGCFGNPCATPNTLRMGEYNGAAAANGVGYVSFTGNGTCSGPSNCQVILFDVFSILGQFPDRFEPNDSRDPGVATDLGSPDSIFLDKLTIHTALDEDFFRVQAHNTGKLTFTMSSDSRASDLDIQAQDASGNVITTSTAGADSNDTEVITIPVVAGGVYFLRVFAQSSTVLPPENHYSLSIVNTPAPVPFALALAPGSDTGRDTNDNVTNDSTPTIRLNVDLTALAGLSASASSSDPGYRIGVYADGSLAGFATPVGGGVFTFTFPTALPDGLRAVTAKVTIIDGTQPTHASGQGGESGALLFTLDTAAPTKAGTTDLLAASDSGGINSDNITTISAPTFAGTAEPNSLVRLYAGGALVGQGFASAVDGSYQLTSSALADGVYDITITQEDLAGNVSPASDALKVTIANQVLNLPGLTANAAAGPITVDLAAGTITGYSGIAGTGNVVGIQGIPVVNLDLNGQALTITGTNTDDGITYTPSGAHSGGVNRAGSSQVLNFTNAGTTFTIDPLAGNDTVTVVGTAGPDTVNVSVDTISTVQVGNWQTLSVPTVNVEKLAISGGQGTDTINVAAANTVNAYLFVDGGDPTSLKKYSDVLNVTAVSPQPQIQNAPGGPVPDSGSVFVKYPKSTGNTTRIDYVNTEKVTTSK